MSKEIRLVQYVALPAPNAANGGLTTLDLTKATSAEIGQMKLSDAQTASVWSVIVNANTLPTLKQLQGLLSMGENLKIQVRLGTKYLNDYLKNFKGTSINITADQPGGMIDGQSLALVDAPNLSISGATIKSGAFTKLNPGITRVTLDKTSSAELSKDDYANLAGRVSVLEGPMTAVKRFAEAAQTQGVTRLGIVTDGSIDDANALVKQNPLFSVATKERLLKILPTDSSFSRNHDGTIFYGSSVTPEKKVVLENYARTFEDLPLTIDEEKGTATINVLPVIIPFMLNSAFGLSTNTSDDLTTTMNGIGKRVTALTGAGATATGVNILIPIFQTDKNNHLVEQTIKGLSANLKPINNTLTATFFAFDPHAAPKDFLDAINIVKRADLAKWSIAYNVPSMSPADQEYIRKNSGLSENQLSFNFNTPATGSFKLDALNRTLADIPDKGIITMTNVSQAPKEAVADLLADNKKSLSYDAPTDTMMVYQRQPDPTEQLTR